MAHSESRHILLVEDEALIALAESRLLEKHGYRVSKAASGEQAVEIARTDKNIDLILMDINLGPGMDGTEAAEIILKNRELPLVFLSSHTERRIVEKTDGITSYGYIVKNSGETVLMASIKMAFRLFEAKLREQAKEAALRQNEFFFVESQRVARVGSFQTDFRTGLWRSSAMLDQIFGIGASYPRDVAGWLGIIHPEDRPELENYVMTEILAGLQPFHREYRIIRQSDGEVRWVRTIGELNLDAQGAAASLIGTIQDITEQKQETADRRASEQRLQVIADNLPAFIAYVGADDLKYQFVNQLFSKNFGMPPEKIIGHHIREVIGEANFRFALPYIEELRQGRPSGYENTFNLTSGKRWIQVSYVPHFDERGKVQGIVVLSVDISERRRAEEALLIKDWAMDSAINGFAIASLDGTLSYVNPALLKMWAYGSMSDVIGRSAQEFWQSPEAAGEVIGILLESGAWQGEMLAKRADGSLFPVELSANLVRDKQGNPVCLMGAFLDLSSHKQHEKRISDLLQEKELLLLETHHRIKNNLNSISGLLSLQALDVADPVARQQLQDAADRVARMMALYHKLHRLDNPRELEIREFLPPLIEEVLGMLQTDRKVIARLEIAELRLHSNLLTTLAIIINELITNSMKHAFGAAASGLISLAISRTGNQLSMSYRDDGIGLPPDIGLGSSSGFGMRLVDMLVGQLNGSVELDRSGGTCFRFSFELDGSASPT